MGSKVVSLFDYHDVPLDIPTFTLDGEALTRELERLANAHATWEEGQSVSSGDMVICDLLSELPRYQRNQVRFIAGSGMFNRVIEDALIDARVGEKIEVTLPEGLVTVTVTSVANRTVCPVDDEMVRDLCLEGVSTVDEYRRHLVSQQMAEHLASIRFNLVGEIERAVVEGSRFELEESDWERAVSLELNRCAAIARQEGLDIKTMTPEQFAGRIPVRSYEELVAMTQETSWNSLRHFLLGRCYAATDGFTVSEKDYRAHIEEYAKAWHLTDEQAREAQPWELYCFTSHCTHAYDLWGAWVERRYYEINDPSSFY